MNAIPVEYASQRKIRERNKLYYRFNHWPIWIFVFFIAPGPLTFDLFERGFDLRMATWLGAVLIGTGIAGLRGKLPGVEPKPYIIRFTEDRPNPLYRRVCYTFAWSEVITFAVLNVAGLVAAIGSGHWYLKQIYLYAYFPIAVTIWLLGALGQLPRVKASTKGEGHERRYFYGSVWAVCWAQPALWLMWKIVPQTRVGDTIKLAIFLAILGYVGRLARLGRLPGLDRLCPASSPFPTRPLGINPHDCHKPAACVVLSGMDAPLTGRLNHHVFAWLAGIVLLHLAVSVVHGTAHSGAQVMLGPAGTWFVYIVILAGPLIGLAVAVRQPELGAAIVGATMAASLVFGLINHFIVQGTDHVSHVAPEWRTLFASTAALLAVLEAAGTAVGVRGAIRTRRTS